VDAAADRLVVACGGRTEESAARVCVLVQVKVVQGVQLPRSSEMMTAALALPSGL
jgi:hypothetical protein